LPSFCVLRDGRSVLDEPIGYEEARRQAAAIGREWGIPVIDVPVAGERITPYARPTTPV
jgi:hypothetical protein